MAALIFIFSITNIRIQYGTYIMYMIMKLKKNNVDVYDAAPALSQRWSYNRSVQNMYIFPEQKNNSIDIHFNPKMLK